MTAASRMAPAALRMQQNAVSIKNSLGRGMESLEALESLRSRETDLNIGSRSINPTTSGILLERVTFSYSSETDESTIKDVSLRVDEGKFIAFVGPTGSGKTTLMNIIGGFLEPTEGFVSINGFSPIEFTKSRPGVIGYVPQNISVINGSIYDNISLGLEKTSESIQACKDALKSAHLWDFVESLPAQIDTYIKGPSGGLSGGQLQRLGIARCLFSKPKIILLDEATSSLDASTEVLVSKEIIRNLEGATLVVIAHRLSTVKEADEIFYLDKGVLISSGSFDELRGQVPNFESQATLLGL
jgi:ABC-type multidrug transport system fused ATPase/permease subunit